MIVNVIYVQQTVSWRFTNSIALAVNMLNERLVLGTATMAAGGAGALACGVIPGTAAGYVGGELSSSGGKAVGELIYSSVGY